MAFDGVTIANVVSELKKELLGGRLYKIAQPEEDELLLTVRQPKGQAPLLISAAASLPQTAVYCFKDRLWFGCKGIFKTVIIGGQRIQFVLGMGHEVGAPRQHFPEGADRWPKPITDGVRYP